MYFLWDYRVVLDLFLGGMGVATFLFATILFFMDTNKYASMIKKGWIVSPILISIGLLLLLTELGRPLNVIKALFNTNMSSVMSIGMFLQGICVALMMLVILKIFTSKTENISITLVVTTSIFAIFVGIYHGFLLTGIEKVAWTDVIPSAFFISSVLSGTAFIALLSLNDKEFVSLNKNVKLPLAMITFLIMQVVTVFSWIYSLALRGYESKQVYIELMNSFSSELVLFVCIGLVLPLAIFSYTFIKNLYNKNLYILASLSIILGSLLFKYIVVYLGQMV